jgi:hypothetical protein
LVDLINSLSIKRYTSSVHALGVLLVDRLRLALLQHLLDTTEELTWGLGLGGGVACVESLEDCLEGLRRILGYLLVVLGIAGANSGEALQNLEQLMPLDVIENGILGSIFSKALQIVADL